MIEPYGHHWFIYRFSRLVLSVQLHLDQSFLFDVILFICLLNFSFPVALIALCWWRKMGRLQRFCEDPRSCFGFYGFQTRYEIMRMQNSRSKSQELEQYHDVHPKHIQTLFEDIWRSSQWCGNDTQLTSCLYIFRLSSFRLFDKWWGHVIESWHLQLDSLAFWLSWAGSVSGARASEPWFKAETYLPKFHHTICGRVVEVDVRRLRVQPGKCITFVPRQGCTDSVNLC